jgi:hypothetical protein
MAAKLTILTHKISIQLQLVAESCTICSSRSRRPDRRLLDTPSFLDQRRMKLSWQFWILREEECRHLYGSIYIVVSVTD